MSEWKEVRLGDVIEFNPAETIQKGTMARKVAMEKIQPFKREIDGFEYAEYNGGAKFRNGDTLMARITPCLENGKTAQVRCMNNDEVAFGSTEFIVLREKEAETVNDYIYYLAISPDFRSKAIQSMTGTSGRQRVQVDLLKDIRINIPSTFEQKAIATVLSAFDEKIEINNQINQKLEEIAQAIFKSWFVDFEPFQDGEFEDSELGMIPKGWRVDSLDGIANFLNGLPMQKYLPETDESLPVIKIKELNQGKTDDSSDIATVNLPPEYIIDNGDVIFSWSGTLVVKLWFGGKGGLNQHLFKVTSDKHAKWFYYYWIKHHLEEFIAIAKSKATTMGHIQRKHLNDAKVLIPSKSDYQFLDSILNPIVEQMTNLGIQNQHLCELRDSLLPKLMSREIEVGEEL